VGNFMTYADGKPAIIDVGVETYTAKTVPQLPDDRRRDAIRRPPVSGNRRRVPCRRQRGGVSSEHCQRLSEGGQSGTLEPDAATVRGKNEIELVDDFSLKQAASEITLTLMTPCAVAQPSAGVLALANTVKVLYDPRTFTPAIEEIKLDDARLRSTWGERLFRILLRAANPKAQAVWTTRITQ
jgi:hypothetical protein